MRQPLRRGGDFRQFLAQCHVSGFEEVGVTLAEHRLRLLNDGLENLVNERTGIVRAETLPQYAWPNKLFFQDWSFPALTAAISRTPGKAYVVSDQDYLSNPPFEPSCGLLPKLSGYSWRD